MAPKPQPGKKGQVEQEDFSDVPTLPPLNSYIFTMLYISFFSHETREKVQKYLQEHLTPDRIKTLTRDEIITFGKTKQIILEPNVAATLPQDDPRLKMNETEQLAKAAVDKLFEMSVHARRAKKEKLAKLEEEAKALQQVDPKAVTPFSQLDSDALDIMFQLVEFPTTQAEAMAFAKYNHSLHCIFEVSQQMKPLQDGVEEGVEQEVPQETEQEIAASKKAEDKLTQLLAARSAAVRTSPLRQMAVIPCIFHNVPQVDIEVNDQGEDVEKRKEAEVLFSAEMNHKFEHYGALFIKYLRFKAKVPLLPLFPDAEAKQGIEMLLREDDAYQKWLGDMTAADQQSLSQSQKDAMDPAQLEEQQRQRSTWRKEVEEQKAQEAKNFEERKKKMAYYREKLKVSVDDEYAIKTEAVNLDRYKGRFLPYVESTNSVASIMSAMVGQIAAENTYEELHQLSQEQPPVEESIDDLLDDMMNFGQQQNRDMSLDDASLDVSGIMQQPSVQHNALKRGTTLAFASQQTQIGLVDYHEELDKSKREMLNLPKEVTELDQEIAAEVCQRKEAAMENLVLPGLNRFMMPPIPSKSQRLRDQERPQLYPFSTLPIDDCERALILKAFQDLLKSNQIDEGLSMAKKHHKYKVFERNFEQHMNPQVLRQALADALINDPDLATLYYPRSDCLLLALYNKIRVGSSEDQSGEPDGGRQWRAAYRVMPDFENWIKYFSDEVVIPPQQQQHLQSVSSAKADTPLTALKYQMDEEMIPDSLLDIDDQKVGSIEEQSEMMYPPDGSIIKVDTFTVGGQTFRKNIVTKDNLRFGLRKQNLAQAQEKVAEENGLIGYRTTSEYEFWAHFENDTRMLVENCQKFRNPQRLIRIDPPKPTPEEIAAREEAIKAAQAAAAKQKGKGGSALANQPPVIEEYKEPEPTWEPEPLDFLDGLFPEEEFQEEHSRVTTTFANGLLVQHLTDGNVVQLNEKQLFDKSQNEEKDRVYLFGSSGVVIRHFRNRDAEVLFPTGVKACFSKKDMMWIITNNKGLRKAKKGGVEWDIDPIPCAFETDAVTNAKMMIREDKVMTIKFRDGSLYCQHADGTMMRTSPDQLEVRIEKDGYAPVVIRQKVSGQETPNELIPRLRASYIMETYMPDGTVVEGFEDILHSDGSMGIRLLFSRPDFSVISVNRLGVIKLVSSNARNAWNEAGGRTLMGKDTDYLKAILDDTSVEGSDQRGLYMCSLVPDKTQCYLATGVDAQRSKTLYSLSSDFSLSKTYYGMNREEDIGQEEPFGGSEGLQEGRELEDVGSYKDPFTKHYLLPRLFVIKNDGSGYELLSKEQLEYYFRIMKYSKESLKQRKIVMVGNTAAKTHYFLSKVKTLQQRELEMTQLKSLDFPQNAKYALWHSSKQSSASTSASDRKNQSLMLSMPEQFVFRQIFEFQDFAPMKQEAFYDDLLRFKQWRISQVRYDTEFGIVHVPAKDQVLDYKKIEDEEFVSRRIITKILKERRNKRKTFNPEEFKRGYVDDITLNEEVNAYQKRLTFMGANDRTEEAMWKNNSNHSKDAADHQHIKYDKFGHKMILENMSVDKIRGIKKKQEANVQNQLQDIRRMINTPLFITNYFQSKAGQMFTKNNPEKPPSQEMLMRMSQRINRSQHNNTDKPGGAAGGQSQYEASQHSQKDNSPKQGAEAAAGQNFQPEGDDKESPIVALEPEDGPKGTAFMRGSQQKSSMGPGGPAPSLYLQEKMFVKQREQEQLLKAEEYHVVKTKDFNVVGRLRQEKPMVKAIQKSQAQTELNEKFITTECIADRRVKISSMAQRQYVIAPSIEEVRKQGQHQMILSAINKKQTFAELINQANAMVTGVLHDPLKRAFNVMPSVLKYGTVQAGQPFELILTMKNEDQIPQRVTVKPINDPRIKVQQVDTGPVASGMIKKISVVIFSNEEGPIKETLHLAAKTDVYKIPIEATILSAENYQKEMQEQKALNGKGLTNSRVRNKLNQSIQRGRMSAKGERELSVEGEDMPGMPKPGGAVWETTNSESRLPQIPQVGKRPFEVDSKKNLQDLLKK